MAREWVSICEAWQPTRVTFLPLEGSHSHLKKQKNLKILNLFLWHTRQSRTNRRIWPNSLLKTYWLFPLFKTKAIKINETIEKGFNQKFYLNSCYGFQTLEFKGGILFSIIWRNVLEENIFLTFALIWLHYNRIRD